MGVDGGIYPQPLLPTPHLARRRRDLSQMSRDPLPCPPQMRNGGSPPAHLSLSSDATIDSSGGWEEDVARLRSSYARLRSRWEEENARLRSRCEENFCRLVDALIAEE